MRAAAFGRIAELYNGRRLLCRQVVMLQGGILGKRRHKRQWCIWYVLQGQIEIRLFRLREDEPFGGTIVTARSEPFVIPAEVQYEILALTDVNAVCMMGNYSHAFAVTEDDTWQVWPDEGRARGH